MAESREQENKPNVTETEKSDKKRVVDVIYTFKPILICENFFGIIRFQLVDGHLQKLNWKIKIFSLFIIISFISANLACFQFTTGYSSNYDIVDVVPAVVIFIQYTISATAASIFVNSPSIEIFNTFAELDNMLKIETIPDFYKKSRKQTNNFLIYLLISHGITGLVDTLSGNPVEIDVRTILVLLMFFFQKLEVTAFCKQVVMIKCRLTVINNYLSNFIQETNKKDITVFVIKPKKAVTEEKFNFIGSASENNMKIRDLARAYDIIGEISSKINKIFNFQMFMTLISTFIQIIITIWASLYYYKASDNNSSGYLINNAIWCFSTISTVAITTYACERLLLVRNETKVLVNKIIMNYDLPKTMRVQAKAFMELTEAWSLRIFIYDMFSVDITLMLKFISVATTYLIVIIQVSHFE